MNLQNIPRGDTSDVKKMFTSRFAKVAEDAAMAEIDYSQLEVVVQGVLSRDKQLMADLNNKVDFHIKRLSAKINRPYDELWHLHHKQKCPEIGVLRTNVKDFSFQRAYGAGAAAIAFATGMSEDDVKELIRLEEIAYPGLVKFDDMLAQEIVDNRIPTAHKLFLEGIAFTQGESHWDSPTGTRYVWRENLAPEWMHKSGKYTGFKPTERKNYPVQGFGGEIVQTMLGRVFRYFMKHDNFNGDILLVNTVHDCVLLDGHGPQFEKVVKDVQAILESVPQVFNHLYPKLKVEVPFPCESEVGPSLFDMHTI